MEGLRKTQANRVEWEALGSHSGVLRYLVAWLGKAVQCMHSGRHLFEVYMRPIFLDACRAGSLLDAETNEIEGIDRPPNHQNGVRSMHDIRAHSRDK
jgi:hypothetical protein